MRSHPVKGLAHTYCIFKDPIPTETKKRKLQEMSNVNMLSQSESSASDNSSATMHKQFKRLKFNDAVDIQMYTKQVP